MNERNKNMNDRQEFKGLFRYEQDSKRFHRFKIETDNGVTGSVYIPKDKISMPKKIILEYADKQAG